MGAGAGRSVLTWGVQEKEDDESRLTLSYDLWMTPEEAIEGYCKLKGKSWDQLTKEGAKLFQKTVIVHDKPNAKSSGVGYRRKVRD